MRPEDAVDLARTRASSARAEGRYADDLAGFTTTPTDRVGTETLMEWAVIEPDPDLMRSTRRLGAPVTFVKRLLLRALQQQFNELTSQESRFHMHLLVHVAELEDRVARLEEELAEVRAEGGGSPV